MKCEVCLSNLEGPILDLGHHPLCDDHEPIGSENLATTYHQEIQLCKICLTAHQLHPVDKSLLFKPSYRYRAAMTKDVLTGMEQLVIDIKEKFAIDKTSYILDIGCNDGSLLSIFKHKLGIMTVGVDPTDAILEAKTRVDHSYQGYFNREISINILKSFGPPKIITFTNVFAHIENLTELIQNIDILMDDNTLLVIENHYLGSIIERFQIDTFYHEHPRTYSLKSFKYISEQLGANVVDIQFPSR